MATNAQIAAKLLRDAAEFFRSVGEQNPDMNADLERNARRYELVAGWVDARPAAECDLDRVFDAEA